MTAVMDTPWGPAQETETCAPGITQVGTATHGGFHLTPPRNAEVHSAWRQHSGWYEEDCESSIVILTFPDVFDNADHQKWACERAQSCFPTQFAAFDAAADTDEDKAALQTLETAAREGFDQIVASAKRIIDDATCQTFGAFSVNEIARWLNNAGLGSRPGSAMSGQVTTALVISALIRDGYLSEPAVHQHDDDEPPWPVYRARRDDWVSEAVGPPGAQ